ncbi:MAG: uracil-DNA glycosylase family protein [Gammaproteobacteria bacterium]
MSPDVANSKSEPENAVVKIARRLARDAGALEFTTPSHVYNPLQYAWAAQREYLERYGQKPGRVILLGMNPGPWGMAQTGVPFGDVTQVREWFRIEAKLARRLPEQHPKYPIMGMNCHRREGSGTRLWGWARERFGTPERFFARFFVWNYCPLLFIGNNRNMTPNQLRREEAVPLTDACDRALALAAEALQPQAVVGIGHYAETRAREVIGERVPVSYLLHPSPANPMANREWPERAERALKPWLPPCCKRAAGK